MRPFRYHGRTDSGLNLKWLWPWLMLICEHCDEPSNCIRTVVISSPAEQRSTSVGSYFKLCN